MSTTNNTTTVRSLTVDGADLVVSVLTVSLSGPTTLPITDTTKNQGTAAAGATVTRFHFSTDGTFDEATDPVLGERAVGALAAGDEQRGHDHFSLPAGTAPGTYTIFARADATGVVTESDESNNRRARTIDTRGSDLIIPNLLFSFGTGADPQRDRHHAQRGSGHGGRVADAHLPVDGRDVRSRVTCRSAFATS